MKSLDERLLGKRKHEYVEYEEPPPDIPVGHAPDYFQQLQSIVRNAANAGILKLLVVLYARISDPRPGKRETTTDQLRAIKTEISDLEQKFDIKIKVVRPTFAESVSGWKFNKRDRQKLVAAAKLARDNDAVLVGFDVSRFVRNQDCQSNTKAKPTVEDFDQFMRLVGKVQLATIASPRIHEDRSRSVKRGHKVNNAKPGRPKKPGATKRRRVDLKIPVIELFKQGLDNREIGRRLGTEESNVRRWKKKYAKYLL